MRDRWLGSAPRCYRRVDWLSPQSALSSRQSPERQGAWALSEPLLRPDESRSRRLS